MAKSDLTTTLGVDGSPFEAGMGKLMDKTTAGMAGVGRQMGQRMTGSLLSVFGYMGVARMISETIRWAKSTQAVRDEYEKMGIVLNDNVVNQMVSAGREFAKMGVSFKITMLPVMVALATTSQAIVQAIQRAWAYWSAVGKGAKAKKDGWMARTSENLWVSGAILTGPRPAGGGATGKETNWEQLKRVRANWRGPLTGEEPTLSEIFAKGSSAMAELDKKIIDGMTQAYLDIQNIPAPGSKITLGGGGGSKGGSRLAAIGGDVGGLNDRVVSIEREQVRILAQIARNTKPKPNTGGTVEIPTS